MQYKSILLSLQNKQFEKARFELDTLTKSLGSNFLLELISAVIDYECGDFVASKNKLEKLRADYGDMYETNLYLGKIYSHDFELNDAVLSINKAIELNPKSADSYIELGNIFVKLRRLFEAIDCYDSALQIETDLQIQSLIYIELAKIFLDLNKLDDAFVHALKAADLNEEIPQMLLLASIYQKLSKPEKSRQIFDDLIVRYGVTREICIHLSYAFVFERNYQQAKNILDTYIGTFESDENILSHMSTIYWLQGDYSRYIDVCLEVCKCNPNAKQKKIDLGMAYLKTGNFQLGGELFALSVIPNPFYEPNIPTWDGSYDVKRLLVVSVLGFGDNINFARLLKHERLVSIDITFVIQDELYELFLHSDLEVSIVRLSEIEAKVSTFDAFCTIFSLLHFLPLDRGTISVLNVNFEIKGSNSLSVDTNNCNGKKIGIAWASSNTKYGSNDDRCVPLSMFGFLANEHTLISLQKDVDLVEIAKFETEYGRLYDNSMNLNSFVDTAAIIASLDVVITTDKSIVHLAGSMGKRTILLLHMVSDWKWANDDDKTYWYESVTICRQDRFGDWNSCIKKLSHLVE